MGSPPYWDGWGGISCDESAIWVYDSIQFNFDVHFRLEDTHVGFDSTFQDSKVIYADWTNPYIAFHDLSLDAICTPERFCHSLNANGIVASTHHVSGGRVLINTNAGVQARFSVQSDHVVSLDREYPVLTALPYLHRITTVVLAEP